VSLPPGISELQKFPTPRIAQQEVSGAPKASWNRARTFSARVPYLEHQETRTSQRAGKFMVLERRYPNEFALKPVHRSEGSSERLIGDKIDESRLRRYSELMAEFKLENEAKVQEQSRSLPATESAAGSDCKRCAATWVGFGSPMFVS